MKPIRSEPSAGSANRRACPAFTLVELVAVLAVLALLASVLGTGIARTRPNTRAYQCLNNNRQLCAAWRMYAEDSRDLMCYASDDGTVSNPLNQYAWTQGYLDLNPGSRYNWDTSYIYQSPLWRYCGGSLSIWKCPSDVSSLVVGGVRKPRIRTFAMNLYLGGFLGSDGGWSLVTPMRIFLKTSEITPSPAKIFVFLDMRPDLINWGNFMTDMTGYSPPSPASYTIMDFPGNAHDNACSFSFADSHVEMKRWVDPRTTPLSPGVSPIGPPYASPRNADIAWLQDHSTRPK